MLSIYEKYKIKKIEDFDDLIKEKYKYIINFFNIIDYNTIPNILLYGEEGSCKKTLIYNFFKNINKEKKNIDFNINNKIYNFFIYYSKYYLELDLLQIDNINKSILLIEFIKDLNSTKNITGFKRIIIIHNIHLLKLNEQFILRKIIENNIEYCRFILISNTINNIIEPIQSRCILLKTPGFTQTFIIKKINEIIKKEKIKISKKNLNKIIEISNKNIKKVFLEIDYYLKLEEYDKQKEYYHIKEENKEKSIIELLDILKIKKIKYEKLDNHLYNLLFEIKINYFDILKLILIIIEKKKEYIKILNNIIDLNYKYSLLNIENLKKNKIIVFLQEYCYELNILLKKNKID